MTKVSTACCGCVSVTMEDGEVVMAYSQFTAHAFRLEAHDLRCRGCSTVTTFPSIGAMMDAFLTQRAYVRPANEVAVMEQAHGEQFRRTHGIALVAG
jgi:hypothetical protein